HQPYRCEDTTLAILPVLIWARRSKWAENDPEWELTRAGDALDRGRRGTLQRAAQAEGVGVFAQRLDAERDVLIERNPELSGALDDVFAVDAAGEGFILHAFFHRTDFQIKNAF